METMESLVSIEINGISGDILVTTSDGNTFPDATTGNVTFLWVDDME